MKVYRDVEVTTNGVTSTVQQEIFDIHEATYTGKDMGERKIDATVLNAEPIDFQVGDYMQIQIANLRGTDTEYEKFYIQTMPSVKKTSSSGSAGDAFEHTVTFYPAQFELGVVQMRDCVQVQTDEKLQYTGYDEFSFMGGAHTLMRRIIYVLNERFGGSIGNGKPDGNPTQEELQTYTGWNYFIAESVDEDINTALESFQFTFSGNTVMDALMKLNDEIGINTEFFINGRTIYVGYKKPYICQVVNGTKNSTPFLFQYGKSSHLKDVAGSTYNEKGGLYDLTKSVGTQSPITRLYAYGSSKNLNRFYCSDRIASGRYAAQLMLPSFMNDGRTDYIQSPDSVIEKFGIREGSKRWEDIYPTIRYVNYATLREIKYVIRVEESGLDGRTPDLTTSLATIRCYKVEPASNGSGVNKLTPAWPEQTLSIFVYATGKTIKCILQGGANAAANQRAQDAIVPRNGLNQQIDGACFCVHMLDIENNIGYSDGLSEHECTSRSQWFTNMDNPGSTLTDEQKEEINLHQIQYTDDYWGTDCFITEMENGAPTYDRQTIFMRDNTSFGCYPVINDNYSQNGESFRNDPNTPIYEVVDIQPVTVEDTDLNMDTGNPTHFYVYMRDIGFKVNQQAFSGQYNWLVQGEFQIEFLDGNMGGKSFAVTADNDAGSNIVCLYKEDGTLNEKWSENDHEVDLTIAARAKANGAIWRFRCTRNTENDRMWLPMKGLNPKAGDHVVFTNIYMPDVYILAAQNRLLKEAQRYLNDNDNGEISYSLSLDAVRMAQQVALGRQMREGAIMRIVDDDLKIYTDNEIQELYKDTTGTWKRETVVGGVETQYIVAPYFFTLRSNKHYKIVFDAGLHAKSSMGDGFVKLYSSLTSGTNSYTPTGITISSVALKRNNQTNRYTVEFDLPSSFNENYDYAFAIAFTGVGYVGVSQDVYLLEVVESNLSGSGVVKYVDLTVDQLTIKMTDLERSYSPTPSARMNAGASSNGSLSKQISATVREKAKASAWSQLMNQISDTTIQSQINEKSAEQNAEVARRNFRQLDSLRNNIFDPDGNVNETFFRTMMLQVGADSMNYVLDRTYIADGIAHNINLYKDGNQWKIGFGYDTLRHYVLTEGGQSGTWKINSTASDTVLADNKIYYLALKCSVNGTTGDWIVEEEQPMRDKYSGFYVFNFGIVMSCEAGDTTRFISETRGNVYVYGDNVVLGRIATQDGSSFIDMMRGKMQLGDGFAYENGTLVLGNSVKIGTGDKTAAQVLADIVAAQSAASNAQSTATSAQSTANSAQSTANTAQNTANSAQGTATNALNVANNKNQNLLPIKYLLDWNKVSTHTSKMALNCEYIDVEEQLLYQNIGLRESYKDIFQGKIKYDANTQYTLKVQWQFIGSTQYGGLRLGFLYSDGRGEETIYCAPTATTKTVNSLTSTSGKTVVGIWCTYGSNAQTRIYNIQLTKGTGTNGFEIASEDLIPSASEQLIACDNPLTIAASSDNYNFVKLIGAHPAINKEYLKAGKVYTFSCDKVEVLSGSTTEFSVGAHNLLSSTNSRSLLVQLPIRNGRVSYSFMLPYDMRNDSVSFIIYAGVQGSTANVSLRFTNVSLQEGLVSAENLVEYTKHLTDSFEAMARSASTDIDGGLVFSSMLQLRDPSTNVVNAGISGVTKDKNNNNENILLWGGGTYQEALYAALNNYQKSSGGALIQTLIKKDGTGKIGIFYIYSDRVEVKTFDNGGNLIGTIVLDPFDGLRIKDASGKDKCIYKPTSISNYHPLVDTTNTTTGHSKSYPNINVQTTENFGNNLSIYTTSSYQTFEAGQQTVTGDIYDMIKTISNTKTSVSNPTTFTLSGRIVRDIMTIPAEHTGKSIISMTAQIKVDIFVGNVIVYTGSTTVELINSIAQYNFTNLAITLSQVTSANPTLSGSVARYARITISSLTSPTTTGYPGRLTTDSYLSKIYMASGTIVQYSKTEVTKYSYLPRTVMGTDGIISMVGNQTYFEVMNDATTKKQKVITKGLPTTATDVGQLYDNGDGIIRIKRS